MKKIALLSLMAFFCGYAFSQIYLPINPTTYGRKENRFKADSAQHIPQKDSLSINTVDTTAQLFYYKQDSSIWAYSKDRGFWRVDAGSGVGSGTVTSVSQGYGIINTPNPITSSGSVAFDSTTVFPQVRSTIPLYRFALEDVLASGDRTFNGNNFQLNIDSSLIMSIGRTDFGKTLTVAGTGTRMFWYPRKAAIRAGFINGNLWDDANIGRYTAAFGFSNQASGESSMSWGEENMAIGFMSTAFGAQTTASGVLSLSTGSLTSALGDNSASFNAETIATGNNASSFGTETLADAYSSVAIGRLNVGGGNASSWVATDPLFEIGIGSGFTRANAMTVLKNGSVGIGTATPSSKAILDLTSTTLGFLPPRMTAAQRLAITSPVAGLTVWDTDSLRYMVHNGTIWKGKAWTSELGSGGAGENFANANLTSTGPRYHSFRNTDQLWIDSLGGTLPLRISTLGTGFLRTVATDGTDSSVLNVFRGASSSLISAVVRRGSVISAMQATNTVAQLSMNDGSRSNIVEAQTQNINLNATKLGGGIGSSIFVIADSISLRPFEGVANIDTLASIHGSDTLFKPMVYKPSTGEWKYATYWNGGGSFIDENFANANLTASADRSHDWNDNSLSINDIRELEFNSTLNGTRQTRLNDMKPFYEGFSIQSIFDAQNQASLSVYNANNASGLYFDASGNSGAYTAIDIAPDSIKINADAGFINFDTLDAIHGSDTTRFKPTVYNSTTGQFKKMTYWPATSIGGSGTVTDFIFTDANGLDGTVTTSTTTPTLSITSTVTDDQVMISNSGAFSGSANLIFNSSNELIVGGTDNGAYAMQVNSTADQILYVTSSSTAGLGGTYYQSATFYVPGMTSGQINQYIIGRNAAVNNAYSIDFKYNGSGSSNNAMSLGFYGANDLALLFANGNFRVGGAAVDAGFMFHVEGTTNFKGESRHENNILLADITAPSTPPPGFGSLYVNSDILYFKDDNGVVTNLLSGGGAHIIKEEGTGLTARSGLNFVGAGITATDDAGNDETDITLDPDLNTIAGLTATTDNFIVSVSSAWASRTPSEVKTTLSLNNVDNTSDATKNSATATLTNKRITLRTGTTTSSATPTINTDNVDFYSITAQAVDITSFTTNLSGTPTEGQKLWIAITGTASRAITWGTSFEASTVSLPATTNGTNRLDCGFVWNTVTSKWRIVATQ